MVLGPIMSMCQVSPPYPHEPYGLPSHCLHNAFITDEVSTVLRECIHAASHPANLFQPT